MKWVERIFNARALHQTRDAVTEEPITMAFTAALDEDYGGRVAIETVPGSYASIREFDEASDRAAEKKDSELYSLIVLPLAEAEAFAEALREFLGSLDVEDAEALRNESGKVAAEEAARR